MPYKLNFRVDCSVEDLRVAMMLMQERYEQTGEENCRCYIEQYRAEIFRRQKEN